MGISKVGDATDREVWLKTRKKYLTASQIYAWRGPDHADPKNHWYFEDNNREVILAEKFDGFEKEFTPESEVSMAHGSFDEENIAFKVEHMLGARVEPDNSMFVNDRWPHVAATVDAFIHHPMDAYKRTNFCHAPEQVEEVRLRLQDLDPDDATVLELKKSVSVAWARGKVPEYYVAQVQTQIQVLDLPFGIITAECLYTDPKQKWRKYWDLRPFVIERDDKWARVLDKCNADFGRELDLRDW